MNQKNYFRHFSNSRNNDKILYLKNKYGWEGKAKLWDLLEIIWESENCKLDISKTYKKASLAIQLDLSEKDLDKFINFLVKELNILQIDDNMCISAKKLLENFEHVKTQQHNKSKAGKKSAESKKKNAAEENERYEIDNNINYDIGDEKETEKNYINRIDIAKEKLLNNEKKIELWKNTFSELQNITDIINDYAVFAKNNYSIYKKNNFKLDHFDSWIFKKLQKENVLRLNKKVANHEKNAKNDVFNDQLPPEIIEN